MSKLYTCTQCRKKKQINEFYLKKNGKPRESCKLCCKEQITSDLVCGLHVPWNLQILPYYENLSKHNKLINEDIV